MTTVKQLREFLTTLPDDAIVRVLKEKTSGYSTTTVWEHLILPDAAGANYTDQLCLWGGTDTEKYLDIGTN